MFLSLADKGSAWVDSTIAERICFCNLAAPRTGWWGFFTTAWRWGIKYIISIAVHIFLFFEYEKIKLFNCICIRSLEHMESINSEYELVASQRPIFLSTHSTYETARNWKKKKKRIIHCFFPSSFGHFNNAASQIYFIFSNIILLNRCELLHNHKKCGATKIWWWHYYCVIINISIMFHCPEQSKNCFGKHWILLNPKNISAKMKLLKASRLIKETNRPRISKEEEIIIPFTLVKAP